jgi:hypothetical protein
MSRSAGGHPRAAADPAFREAIIAQAAVPFNTKPPRRPAESAPAQRGGEWHASCRSIVWKRSRGNDDSLEEIKGKPEPLPGSEKHCPVGKKIE